MQNAPVRAMEHADIPDFFGKKVLVVGLGISGIWVARWLIQQGAKVTVSDLRPERELDPRWCQELREAGVVLETGAHIPRTFMDSEGIIISPGVSAHMPLVLDASRKGIPIWGELELAARVVDTPIIAVTGTNGKSTVTRLLGHLLDAGGLRTFVGGNIGTPLMAYACSRQRADYVVAEVSSFQLDTTETFCPLVSIILNVSPDHLDRYESYEHYVQSKLRILRNQGEGQYVILNDDDRALSSADFPSGPSLLRYGCRSSGNRQAFLNGDQLVVSVDGKTELRFSTNNFTLPGAHNLENLMAVVLAGLVLGIDPSIIQSAIGQFKPLSHRLERIAEHQGILVYDDSKATNEDAAVRAIRCFDRPVVLIAGGRHKGGDYTALVEAARGNVKRAVLIGEARELLAAALGRFIPVTLAGSMEEAVSAAFASSRKGDVILLAPACASFDMYRDYAHRGEAFRHAVNREIHDRENV